MAKRTGVWRQLARCGGKGAERPAARAVRCARAFTLVELLVVIAIIGVLVALLLPAIQAAREASRRTDCINKMHQLGICLHNYEGSKKKLPPGQLGYDSTKDNAPPYNSPAKPETTFVVYVLPYLEEGNLYKQYDFKLSTQVQYNTAGSPVGKLLPSFQCPSDEPQQTTGCSANSTDWKGNYGLNWGAYSAGCQRPDPAIHPTQLAELGVSQGACPTPQPQLRVAPFHIEFGAKLSQITDGLSNTLAMMEMVQTDSAEVCDRRARIWNESSGCYTVMTRNQPNSSRRDEGNCRSDLPDAPCNDIPGGKARTESHNASRSRHPGGVVALFCDSSTHFIKDDVDLVVWQALSTMEGDEVVQLPF